MRRAYFKRHVPSMAKLPTNYRQMKARAALKAMSDSPSAVSKRNIQALLREYVILRDGGCILRNVRRCGGDIGYAVLQADHLITRSNSATYADSRLVVCVCKPCHAWKSLGNNRRKAEYDTLVKTLLPSERVALWEACERDDWRPNRAGAYDWQVAEAALRHELMELKQKAAL